MAFADDHCIEIAATTAACASGTSVVTSAAVDCAGFDGALFIVPMGPITGSAVTSVKLTQCDTAAGSYADLTGTSQTIADTDDNKLFYLDIFRPEKRYLKLVLTRGTAAATAGGIIVLKYNASSRPVTHGTNVAGESFNWVSEGTA